MTIVNYTHASDTHQTQA